MKEIKTVGIIGLGALGTLYAHLFTQALGPERVLVLADRDRAARYRAQGVFFNGQPCAFHYADASQVRQPVDLLLFAVKFSGLPASMETCRHLVGPDTILLSVLNGISSEALLGEAFGAEKVVWCVAQKMTAVKEGNHVNVDPIGELALGVPAWAEESRLRRLTALLDRIGFPYLLHPDIRRHMWSKLLCNTGANQTTMVYQCSYEGIQCPGPARETMLGAMREVVAVANAEGVPLSEEDVTHWTSILDALPPDGEPSMRQDGKAHRKSEVELFSGTIRRLAARHQIPVPVNDRLYEAVQKMEAAY